MDLLVENVLHFLETDPHVLILGNGPLFACQPVLVAEDLFYQEYLPRLYQLLCKINEPRDLTIGVSSTSSIARELSHFIKRSVFNIWNNQTRLRRGSW